jgi:5-methylcytosine-specific restriction protein A
MCDKEVERVIWRYPEKRLITNFFCGTKCKGNWQTKQREDLGYTKEWLEHQYLTMGKSANDIASEVGRDPKRVWEWIRNYGIPTRGRGQDDRYQFKTGQESAFKGKKHKPETKELFRIQKLENPTLKGVFGKDHPRFGLRPKSWKGGIAAERQSVYGTQEWKSAVRAIWKRDNATCQRCKIHKNDDRSLDFDIHHIVGFENKLLRCEPSNLVLLCEKCHYWVHSKKNQEKLFIG